MKEYFLYLFVLILFYSCGEKKDNYQEKLKRAENVMYISDISLEEKYDSIKEIYFDLPKNLQVKYGQKFVPGFLKASLGLVNKNIVIRLSGSLYPNFKNKVFTEGQIEIYSNLSFPNKDFKSIYIFDNISFTSEAIVIDVVQPLDNSFNIGTGKASELVTINTSFLSHTSESLDGYVVLKLRNEIGDRCDLVISVFDLKEEWNIYSGDKNERLIFLSTENQSNNTSSPKIKPNKMESENSEYDKENNMLALKAEKMFSNYLPTILKSKSEGTELFVQNTHVGDFTGDGLSDVIIYFTYGSLSGGSGGSLEGIEAAFYKNKNNQLKVVGGFEPDYMFSIDKIENGTVYCTKVKYSEDDPRCCPSLKYPIELKYVNGKIYVEEK